MQRLIQPDSVFSSKLHAVACVKPATTKSERRRFMSAAPTPSAGRPRRRLCRAVTVASLAEAIRITMARRAAPGGLHPDSKLGGRRRNAAG